MYLVFIAGLFTVAALLFYHQTKDELPLIDETPQSVSGIVAQSPTETAGGNYLRFQWQTAMIGNVLVYVNQEEGPVVIPSGSRCLISEPDLIRPQGPSNPHEFDFATHLYRQNIHNQLFISPHQIRCHPDKAGGFHLIRRFREAGIQKVDDGISGIAPRSSALMKALVFGDRGDIPDDILNAYQRLGIIHLLAVSGLHVGLLTLYLHWILMRIGLTRETAIWLLLFILPFFMIVAGGAPSVVRASVTVMIVILVKKTGQGLMAADAISLVCILLLIMNPALIHHIGFQLSFLTSFTLILSVTILKNESRTRQLMLVTISAQVISAPVTIGAFYEWSVLAVFANLLMVPLVTVILLPTAFLSVLLLNLHQSLAYIPVAIMEGILVAVDSILVQSGERSFAAILFGSLSEWQLLMLCASTLSFFLIWELSGGRRLLKAGIPFLLSLGIVYATPYFDSGTTVTFLDVGQGDAAVIELPFRRGVYMVDTGGIRDWHDADGPYEFTIKPFLRGQGIRKLDKVLLSHGHHDHVGEMCAIVKDIQVDLVLFSGAKEPEPIMLETLHCVQDLGGRVSYSSRGDRWIDGDSYWQVLHPEPGDAFSENDMSMVLHASIQGVTILFTGDVEETVEARLVERNLLTPVDILKVAHHGSRTSSTVQFVAATDPAEAVISAGRHNTYGHPHEDVVNRFLDQGTVLYQTADEGAVQYRIQNGSYEVETFRLEQ
ncbi:Late competence protein ComEC, DNA transport [Salisediminibacterium beveridgei]|uniref:Late competence protein ComEC, DNA transport n=2 Tax=Salisediminibacterium beveridgei TaxID=632773 RepID=A0A1D7QU72_9BACI|nr:Late competence protein ComEC, DNA transport [Salisediminibacterium beveridgei]